MGKRARVVLRGGTVIDGTGAPARQADVAVVGERIAAVGHVEPAAGDDVLDVAGLAVAPGFHDVHTHFDLSLLAYPSHLDGLCQGITTYHVGQCGLGLAPASEATLSVFREYMAPLMGDHELPACASVADYLDLFRRRTTVNVVHILPHGLLRAEVAGMTRGPLTPQQLDRMKGLVAEGMQQGARGISTGLTYFPGCEADLDELVAVAEVVARHGGVYSSHLRSYVDGLLDAIDEAAEIGLRAGLPVHLSHLRPSGRYSGRADEVLAHIEALRDRGADITFDIYTYLKGCTIMAALVLPPAAYEGGIDAAIGRLRDPAERERLRRAFPEFDASEVHIASVGSERNRHFEGMKLSDFAAAQGGDLFGVCVKLLIEERFRVSVVGWPILDEDHRRVLRHPLCLVGSDSIPVGGSRHPRASGCFARYLGHYVRELGLLPLEEAIRRITSVAARRFGIEDRGVIAEGQAADLVVFDPANIRDRATYDQPRLLAEGVRHVFVNGRLVLREGGLAP